MYTVDRAIRDYSHEIQTARKWKADGITHIDRRAVPEELEGKYGPEGCPIDLYIGWWEEKLAQLEDMKLAGIQDASSYNY